MTRPKLATAALALVLATACGPTTDNFPAAQAQSPQPLGGAAAYPEVSADAGDGQVYEYH